MQKKYFLLNVGLVAPKMQVTLNHEYLEPEACTDTKLSNLKRMLQVFAQQNPQ